MTRCSMSDQDEIGIEDGEAISVNRPSRFDSVLNAEDAAICDYASYLIQMHTTSDIDFALRTVAAKIRANCPKGV